MKYVPLSQLSTSLSSLHSLLQSTSSSLNLSFVMSVYSVKRTNFDKKFGGELESVIREETEGEPSSAHSSLTIRTLCDIIMTLNMQYPFYDFSGARFKDFDPIPILPSQNTPQHYGVIFNALVEACMANVSGGDNAMRIDVVGRVTDCLNQVKALIPAPATILEYRASSYDEIASTTLSSTSDSAAGGAEGADVINVAMSGSSETDEADGDVTITNGKCWVVVGKAEKKIAIISFFESLNKNKLENGHGHFEEEEDCDVADCSYSVGDNFDSFEEY